jgi:hypothetical protein
MPGGKLTRVAVNRPLIPLKNTENTYTTSLAQRALPRQNRVQVLKKQRGAGSTGRVGNGRR